MNAEALFTPSPLTDDELTRLALFPLPSTVLFPHTFLPLHIFEPRYRTMVTEVIKSGGAMGVVMLQGGVEAAAPERPAVCAVAGAGRIVHHNELADGRYMILLRGLARVRVLDEKETVEPFRRFSVKALSEKLVAADEASERVRTMKNCATQVALAMTEGGPELLKACGMARTPGQLADLLASALIGEPHLQQELLEMLNEGARSDRVVSAMAELLLSLPGEQVTPGYEN